MDDEQRRFKNSRRLQLATGTQMRRKCLRKEADKNQYGQRNKRSSVARTFKEQSGDNTSED